MKIGFDLDKVFIDLPPFIPAYLFDKFYKKRSNGVLEYRIPKRPEQFLRAFLHYPKFRQPIKENIMFLKEISAKNELYLISSRYNFLRKRTDELVKKYSFEKLFKGLFFNYKNEQAHLFKNRILNTLHLEKYVDDDLALLKYLAKHNKTVRFYWLNQKQKGQMTRNLIAITKLSQIL